MKKMNAIWGIGIIVACLVFMTGPAALADDNEVGDLKNQVRDLNDKLDSLEKYVKTMGAAGTQFKEGMVTQPMPTGEHPGGLIHTMKDINMTGFMDVQFNNNLSGEQKGDDGASPDGNPGGTPLRVFDNDADTFAVNLAEIDFEKLADPEGGVGFRVDVAMGEDAEAVDGGTFGSDGDEFSIQQAYVQLVAPLKFFEGNEIFDDMVDIKVGRFVTLAGAEVIEAKDNWNASRSFMFGFSIPFTHTGARAKYMLWNDKITTYWGVNNGWDNVIDNNTYKTLEWGASFSPIEDVTVTSSIYFGPENVDQIGHKRFLLSNVLAWSVTDKLSLLGNIDFGTQRRVIGLGGLEQDSAQWHGYAAYARYQLTDKWAGAYRFEFFRDDDDFRTDGAQPIPQDESLWAQTFTMERKIYDSLVSRLEYRFDKSNANTVFDEDSSQSTLSLQLLYSFA